MIEPSTINAALTILETKQQEIFSEIDELKNSYREIGEEIHNLRKRNSREACDGGAGECPASLRVRTAGNR